MIFSLSAFFLFLSTLLASAASYGIGTIGSVTKQESIKKLSSGSELLALYTEPAYENPIYLLNLHGESSYSQGFDAGVLIGNQIVENYNSLFLALLGDIRIEPQLQALATAFFYWQWTDYLSKDVPQEYMDEIAGIDAGALTLGLENVGIMTASGITLANLPGSGKDIIFVLLDEFEKTQNLTPAQRALMPVLRKMMEQFKGHQCSMFGAWGSRTVDGRILSARNLDWVTDLGINKYKLLTVHHPPNGNSHVTIGFSGIWGAMAGMSSQGLTVHEANLESKLDTFQGFPWILRLRHVMAYSSNLAEALTIWADTNNTVGFNHMIASTKDQKAICMETMKGYTAYFSPMDPREDGALDPQTGEQYGYTLSEAIYRTNHGYDPVTQKMYQWYGYSAYEDSKRRYKTIYDYMVNYSSTGVLMGPQEAVTITSAIGIKGNGKDENNCNPDLFLEGENIMSITFDPTDRILYTAFENGSGDEWVPAACNGYIMIDMKQWL